MAFGMALIIQLHFSDPNINKIKSGRDKPDKISQVIDIIIGKNQPDETAEPKIKVPTLSNLDSKPLEESLQVAEAIR